MYPIEITSYNYWLVVWNICFFSHILGMSSSQLIFIFFRGVGLNHQPDTVTARLPAISIYDPIYGMFDLIEKTSYN